MRYFPLLALLILVGSSCSRPVKELSYLEIKVPDLEKAGQKLQSSGLQDRELSEFSEMNCYMVVIGGPEEELKRNSCLVEELGSKQIKFGPWLGGFNSKVSASLSLKAGLARQISLLGFHAKAGQCQKLERGRITDGDAFSKFKLLAQKTVDLSPGDQIIKMNLPSQLSGLSEVDIERCDIEGLEFLGTHSLSQITTDYKLSSHRIHLDPGEVKKIQVSLDTPATQNAKVPIKVYGPQSSSINDILQGTLKELFIPKGASEVSFDLFYPLSPSFTGQGQLTLVLDSFKLARSSVHVNIHTNNQRSFDLLSAGSNHACGIDNGELFCWGKNTYGQVGNGAASTENVLSPVRIGTSTTWTQISAGSNHTCGIDNGALYCWGQDAYGEVGNGATTGDVASPEQIGSSTSWTHVATGGVHTCGIDAGKLYCWGRDHYGQLGNGALTANVLSPEQIGASTTWSHIAAGNLHNCGVDGGTLYCWGKDSEGEVGNGAATGNVVSPSQIGASTGWSFVAAGSYHTCGIDAGELLCWGRNLYGQIGIGATTPNIESPTQVGTSNAWEQVTIGRNHTCGMISGSLYCWGRDNLGQLGNGTIVEDDVLTPEKIGQSESWTLITAGADYTCGITNNKLRCWGSNSSGELGNDLDMSAVTPEKLGSDLSWEQTSAGGYHSCAINNGALYCWGNDNFGRVGNGDGAGNAYSPERIGESTSWTQVATGRDHSCGIMDGSLYCWGRDDYGQIGNGISSADDVLAPEKIGLSTNWTQVSAGRSHSCGIREGVLFCWGKNINNEIGNGPGSSSVHSPQQIGVSTSWTQVSAGGSHTCGINSGELYCWGRAQNGRLGNGVISGSFDSPQKIGASANWTAVSAGSSHTCGLDAGVPYCWGIALNGRLGNGATTGEAASPVRISPSSNWTQITVGDSHSCGIDSGALYCWGKDSNGQLGNGTISADIDTATQIGARTDWTQVSSGALHTSAIKAGELFEFGVRYVRPVAEEPGD